MVDVKNGSVSFFVLFVFALFILVFLAATAAAYVELEVYKDRCYADGSISVTVVNGKTEPYNIEETKLLVQNAYERNRTLMPEGRWTEPIVYYNYTTGMSHESTFIGNEDLITEPGDYHLFVSYDGCRQGRCTTGATLKNCLAHNIDCYKYRPLVYDCSVDLDERMAYVRFGGEKNRFFTEVDPGRDLVYYIKSDMRDLEGVRRVEGVAFSKIGDIREMRFPLLKDEAVSEVAIVHNRCDSPFQQQKRVVCSSVARGGKRGINSALRAEQAGIADLPERRQEPEEDTEDTRGAQQVKAQQEIVEKIIQQKEEEARQKVVEAEQEIEKTKAELEAYKQLAQEAEVQQQETQQPAEVPGVTGAAVGTGKTGIPKPFFIVAALVIIGVLVLAATNIYSKKKKEHERRQKEEEERKEKSFGFGE